MKWTEICVHTNEEAWEMVSFYLQELGAEGVSIEDSEMLQRSPNMELGELIELNPNDYPATGIRIKSYLPETINSDHFCRRLKEKLEQLKALGIDPAPATIEQVIVDEESWANAWKKYYKPLKVTERLTVQPIWEDYERNDDEELIIRLDPGMAFGTGTHPTTILSLKLLEKYLSPGDEVIDVGCGSGILSIASALLGASNVLALDLDPVAVKSSQENIAINDLQEKIEVRQGDLLKGVTKKAEIVVSNILAEIIVQFTSDLPKVLKDSGLFIASGIIEERKDLVLQSLKENRLEIIDIICQEGWVAITAKK